MSLKPRHRRAALILACLGLLGVAAALGLQALRSHLVFFVTPQQLARGEVDRGATLRLGGMVQAGSVQREPGSLQVRFVLTDASGQGVPVVHEGVLPDLFAEGKGAVAQGRLDAQGTLQASEVLAKHDENYVPPGVDTGHPGGPPGARAVEATPRAPANTAVAAVSRSTP
ncbi:cytochrome c maturation protein CcmE [Ideonella livida]|uniref:Cytochrome c-type biogenesis protein CcmE n=1 Tax=Ideonella livida TaxID=2707176 RepID=A0A7C9TIT5_9BURK|nr:cytochrome c maturation protein CcmE [Ideonella livida]NDY91480.1 cytochrome c maturation protein CcmE [Ideonella livida]